MLTLRCFAVPGRAAMLVVNFTGPEDSMLSPLNRTSSYLCSKKRFFQMVFRDIDSSCMVSNRLISVNEWSVRERELFKES